SNSHFADPCHPINPSVPNAMHCNNSINSQMRPTGAVTANPKYAPAATNSTVASNVRPTISLVNRDSRNAINDTSGPPLAASSKTTETHSLFVILHVSIYHDTR